MRVSGEECWIELSGWFSVVTMRHKTCFEIISEG